MKKSGKAKAANYLQWVGAASYPTVNHFIDEAERKGVCKKIGTLPDDLVPNESRVFLAHDDGLTGEGFIFGYYVPDRIEYLVLDENDIPPKVHDRVTWIRDWYKEEGRECGYRDEGMYLVRNVTASRDQYLVLFDKPRTLEAFDPGRSRFRGLLEIDYGKELMDKVRKTNTMVPPSWIERELVEVDDDELVERVEAGPSMARVCQEIAYETGQKKTQVIYRYLKLSGKVVLTGRKK